MKTSDGARRQQVLSPQQLAQLIKKSDSAGLWRLLQHVAAMLLCGWLMTRFDGVIALAAGLGYSILLAFSFCPLHESIHNSTFATRWLNQTTGFACSLVLMLPPRYFNAFHMAHHRHTQISGKDPELLTAKPTSVAHFLFLISGISYWRSQLSSLISLSLGKSDPVIPATRIQSVINEARLFVLIYLITLIASLYFQSLALWWFWLLPVIVGQPFLRLFLMAEHTGLPNVENMFANTRTTKTNRLMQWLAWNMNYHTEHHAYAGIPFHQLPAANAELNAHLVNIGEGYIKVNANIIAAARHR